MSCNFDKEIIQKYVDNAIDPLEFIFLKEHLNYCGECRRELDLVMTLDSELGKFFDEEVGSKEFDFLITRLVDDCIDEVERKKKLRYALSRGMELSGRIMGNSVRFVEYIPGSKSIGNGMKKTASKTRGLFKNLLKKEIGRLLESVR